MNEDSTPQRSVPTLSGTAVTCILLAVVISMTGCGNDSDGGIAPPPPDPSGNDGDISLSLIAEGLTSPVLLISPPDGSGRLFVVDQAGLLRIIDADGQLQLDPFLDLRDRMVPLNPNFDERGLLGLAFHPDFARNGLFYVYYSAPLRPTGPASWNHTSRVSRFSISGDPDLADPGSESLILEIDQPQGNHNAGMIAFGSDGFLYISLGDGGGANDRGTGHPAGGNGQDINTPLGSILRIDVDTGNPFSVPAGNPFVGTPEGLDEIFAYGFRNPFRFSFDMGGSGDLIVGDAGQALWEEVSLVESGGNYGWPRKEGAHCFDPNSPTQSPPSCSSTGARGEPLLDPVIEYSNGGLGVAVIGGFVYRGLEVPGLSGRYIFGDFQAANGSGALLFRATPVGSGPWSFEELRVTGTQNGRLAENLLGFGQDRDGEVYVLTSSRSGPGGSTGRVYKIQPDR